MSNSIFFKLGDVSFVLYGYDTERDLKRAERDIKRALAALAQGCGAVCDIRKLLPIRRFTPTECARLQGMPDWWCADIPHSDTAEYKMWGNGMALPNALYVMEGIAATSGEEEK